MMLLNILVDPWHHTFMRHAFLAMLIVGIVCGVIGTFVVLRGMAFMGDALAHAIFPGVVIAFVLGGNFLVGALVAAMIVSLGIGLVQQSGRLSNDTAIGVLFVGAFALGVAIISTQRTYARDVTSFLFGSILGVSTDDLLLSASIGALVLLVMLVFRRELVTTSFDRVFGSSVGLKLWRWDQVFLLLLSLTIVISLQTVGNILVLAMLVTPAATARLSARDLKRMTLWGVGFGVSEGVVGLMIAYHLSSAPGATIGLVAAAVFAVVFAITLPRRMPHHHRPLA